MLELEAGTCASLHAEQLTISFNARHEQVLVHLCHCNKLTLSRCHLSLDEDQVQLES